MILYHYIWNQKSYRLEILIEWTSLFVTRSEIESKNEVKSAATLLSLQITIIQGHCSIFRVFFLFNQIKVHEMSKSIIGEKSEIFSSSSSEL